VNFGLLRLGFWRDYVMFKRMASRSKTRFTMRWQDRYACLYDRTASTPFDRHYLYHIAWASRILARTNPELHIDISSSLNFCTVVSAFIPVKFYDFRPADLQLTNFSAEQADLIALPFPDQGVSSLSCMHVIEHIGLGRYGDKLDPDGDLKAIRELQRVLKQNGSLLFVVPIGKPRIQFNAHRIYSYQQISGYFQGFRLEEFALIPDRPEDGGLIIGASKEMADAQTYGCGCFWFKKT
jgi:SAM-dependent methyltransferase